MRKTARSLCTAFAIAAATLAATAAMSGAHANEAVVFDTERLRAWGEIESLAWPLQVAAADQCKDPSYHTGIELLASPGQGFFVRNVSQGSPAHGLLEVEDRVVALDGHRFAQDPMQAYETWIGGMRADLLASDETQRWTVLRNDVEHAVEIEPTKV